MRSAAAGLSVRAGDRRRCSERADLGQRHEVRLTLIVGVIGIAALVKLAQPGGQRVGNA